MLIRSGKAPSLRRGKQNKLPQSDDDSRLKISLLGEEKAFCAVKRKVGRNSKAFGQGHFGQTTESDRIKKQTNQVVMVEGKKKAHRVLARFYDSESK